MTRIRSRGAELDLVLEMALQIGPTVRDDLTDEDLELGWRIHGARLMSRERRRSGYRPWGWWVFEAGEDPPRQEPGAEQIRLAELGEMFQVATSLRACADWGGLMRELIEGGEPLGPLGTEHAAWLAERGLS